METSIEVRYAGVVVGRTSHARELGGGEQLFVGIAEPLPVGTLVTLKIGDAVRDARVAEVVEAADPSSVGMRVSFDVGARDASPAPVAAPAVAAPEPAQDAPSAAVAAEAEASESISAPLSLAEPGGGKRRRKRR